MRTCPKCGEGNLVRDKNILADFKCDKCLATFEFTNSQKNMLSILSDVSICIAFIGGFISQSWIFFFVFLVIIPYLLHKAIENIAVLKLTDAKAILKEKGL